MRLPILLVILGSATAREIALLGALACLAACGSKGGGPSDLGCQGCLSSASSAECLPGNTSSACGVGGQACVACADGEQCADGACAVPPACRPGTCDGCCSNGTCVAGASDDACGHGGNACATCDTAGCRDDGEGLVCATPCGPATCAGCCDDAWTCRSTASDSACGTGGAACAGCTAGAHCFEGQCTADAASLCAKTCAGCCQPDGTCVTDQLIDLKVCGWNGKACEVCDGTIGFCFSPGNGCQQPGETGPPCSGQCVSGSGCTDGTLETACGKDCADCTRFAGLSCQNGLCLPPADSLWDFVLLSAQVPATDADGNSWDAFGGLPDPYVWIRIGGNRDEYSSSKTDTLSGVWNEVVFTFHRDEIYAAFGIWYLNLRLMDDDFTFDQGMVNCLALNELATTATVVRVFAGGVKECADGGAVVRYEIRPHL